MLTQAIKINVVIIGTQYNTRKMKKNQVFRSERLVADVLLSLIIFKHEHRFHWVKRNL